MHAKMMRYDRVVRRLNEYRKDGFNFALAHALAEAATSGSAAADSKAVQTADTYSLLASVVREHDVQNGEYQREAVGERQYAPAYQARMAESVRGGETYVVPDGGSEDGGEGEGGGGLALEGADLDDGTGSHFCCWRQRVKDEGELAKGERRR